MPLDDTDAGRLMNAASVPLTELRPDPENPRRTLGDLAELTESLREVGQLVPLIVRLEPGADGARYTVVKGSRRLAAARGAGLTEMSIVVRPAGENVHSAQLLHAVATSVRRDLTPVEQWRRIRALRGQDLSDEAIAAALGRPVRHIQKLALLGGLLPAILDTIESTGRMPPEHDLKTIANAPIADQKSAWKAHRPQKEEPPTWWNLSNALNGRRLRKKHARFSDELAREYGVTWLEDLFEEPKEAAYTRDVVGFMAAQKAWITREVLPRFTLLQGYSCELLTLSPDGMARPPAGAERRPSSYEEGRTGIEPGGVAQAWTRGFYVDPSDGEVLCLYYKPAAAAPRPAGIEPPQAPRPVALPLTAKGMERVAEVKRQSVAAGVMECADPARLLAVALLLLGDKVGDGRAVLGVLNAAGALDVAAPDFQRRATAAAHGLLARLIEKAPRNTYDQSHSQLRTVERIGAGLGEAPTWEASEEDLAQLKKEALMAIAVGGGAKPATTGKAIREQLLRAAGDGRVAITPELLPVLAWAVTPPPPAEPDEDSGDEPGEDDAAAEQEAAHA